MENSPQCMSYIPWKTDSLNEDTILFGDDQGKFDHPHSGKILCCQLGAKHILYLPTLMHYALVSRLRSKDIDLIEDKSGRVVLKKCHFISDLCIIICVFQICVLFLCSL